MTIFLNNLKNTLKKSKVKILES